MRLILTGCYSKSFEWFKRFQGGRESVGGDERFGWTVGVVLHSSGDDPPRT